MRISESIFRTLGMMALLISWSGVARAQFPVTDPSSIAQAVKANVNYLQQLKQVQAAAGSVEKMNAAIGKAASSFSEFTGQLQEQKAKLEAKKAKYEAKLAKLEKRKAQLEAAKNKVKNTVDNVTDTVDNVKDKVDEVKNQVNEYKNTVDQVGKTIDSVSNINDLSDLSDAVDDVGNTYGSVSGSVENIGSDGLGLGETVDTLTQDVKQGINNVSSDYKQTTSEYKGIINEAEQDYQKAKSSAEAAKQEYQQIKKENKGFRQRPNLSLAPFGPVSGHAVYASGEILAFGQMSVYTGTTETNVFIFPDALAEFCEINAEDVKEEGVMSDCLNKLLELKNSEDMSLKQKAVDICRLAHQQFVVAGIEEAILAKKNLYNLEKDTLPELMEKSQSANDERLLFGSLSAIDTENVKLLNSMAMNYATQSMLSAFKDFCDLEVQQKTDLDN